MEKVLLDLSVSQIENGHSDLWELRFEEFATLNGKILTQIFFKSNEILKAQANQVFKLFTNLISQDLEIYIQAVEDFPALVELRVAQNGRIKTLSTIEKNSNITKCDIGQRGVHLSVITDLPIDLESIREYLSFSTLSLRSLAISISYKSIQFDELVSYVYPKITDVTENELRQIFGLSENFVVHYHAPTGIFLMIESNPTGEVAQLSLECFASMCGTPVGDSRMTELIQWEFSQLEWEEYDLQINMNGENTTYKTQLISTSPLFQRIILVADFEGEDMIPDLTYAATTLLDEFFHTQSIEKPVQKTDSFASQAARNICEILSRSRETAQVQQLMEGFGASTWEHMYEELRTRFENDS